jgi:hypothetical protein
MDGERRPRQEAAALLSKYYEAILLPFTELRDCTTLVNICGGRLQGMDEKPKHSKLAKCVVFPTPHCSRDVLFRLQTFYVSARVALPRGTGIAMVTLGTVARWPRPVWCKFIQFHVFSHATATPTYRSSKREVSSRFCGCLLSPRLLRSSLHTKFDWHPVPISRQHLKWILPCTVTSRQ